MLQCRSLHEGGRLCFVSENWLGNEMLKNRTRSLHINYHFVFFSECDSTFCSSQFSFLSFNK